MKILRSILILLGLIVVSCYIVFSMTFFSKQKESLICKKMEVEINDSTNFHFITEKDIAILLANSNLTPIGKMLTEINVETIENEVEKHAAVERAECFKTPSGSVQIEVFQRKPFFRIMSNEDFYIDTNGKKMPTSLQCTAHVPIVSGNADKVSLPVIIDFMEYISREDFWNAQIEQIHVFDSTLVELTPRVGNHQIILGSFDNYEKKLSKLKTFYLNGINQMDWNRYKKLDLRYKNQVIGIK